MIKKKKRSIKVKDNQITKDKNFNKVLDLMIDTNFINDKELKEWIKKNSKLQK